MKNRKEAIKNFLECYEFFWKNDGIKLTTPGIIKELIISDILGHKVVKTKHDVDACSIVNPDDKYEYLCCEEGGSFQMDRMYGINKTKEQQKKSQHRIKRNKYFYHVIFYKNNPIYVKEIYEIEMGVVLSKAMENLNNENNESNHISFSLSWTRKNGKLVYSGNGD